MPVDEQSQSHSAVDPMLRAGIFLSPHSGARVSLADVE